MPLLFGLAIHNALSEEGVDPAELLFAFLGDVCVMCSPQRIREGYNSLSEKLAVVGIQLHAGKTRTRNKAGIRPTDLEDLGADVWNPDGLRSWALPWALTSSLLTCRSQVGGVETTLGGHLDRAGHTTRVADPAPVRWSEMSPHPLQ